MKWKLLDWNRKLEFISVKISGSSKSGTGRLSELILSTFLAFGLYDFAFWE
jgi:hypothetical protein